MKIQKNDPLYVQVYNILKQSLLEGQFKPGEKIVESKVAEDLGVSRSPVREAIRLLEKEELLIQNGNAIIAQRFTKKDIIDVYLCRKALESIAAELAAKTISAEEIEQIEKILHLSKESFIKGNGKDVAKYNTLFHYAIVKASNNKSLTHLLDSISTRVVYYRNMIVSNFHRNDAFQEHMKIVEALNKHDDVLAKKLMEDHIDQDIREFLKILEDSRKL